MASPVADSYSCASGGVIAGGRQYSATWASGLAANTWTQLTGTNFLTWANANIPSGAYQGNFPFEAIVDAFSDGTFDPVTRVSYLNGGGHNDGSCNAVVKVDTRTLAYSVVGQPTPPSKYPPSYYAGGNPQPGPLVYPSGAGNEILAPGTSTVQGYSHFRNDLTDAADTAYNTPVARKTSHMYSSSCVRNGVVHYFYGNYGEFNANTSTWNSVDGADQSFGSQMMAFNSNFGPQMFQHGCCAVYDTVTDRAFVTFTAGDSAGSWRSHLCKTNLGTRTIEEFIGITNSANYPLLSESQIYQVGRKIYVFMNTPSGANITNDTGAIYHIDTGAVEYFNMSGDATVFANGSTIETIPAVIHNGYVYRWNYSSATDRDYLYKASITPVSGVGTKADPYILSQTKQATANAAPTNGHLIYRRLWLDPSGAILVLPRANSNLYALKLT